MTVVVDTGGDSWSNEMGDVKVGESVVGTSVAKVGLAVGSSSPVGIDGVACSSPPAVRSSSDSSGEVGSNVGSSVIGARLGRGEGALEGFIVGCRVGFCVGSDVVWTVGSGVGSGVSGINRSLLLVMSRGFSSCILTACSPPVFSFDSSSQLGSKQ